MVFQSVQTSHKYLEKLLPGATVCWLLKWGMHLCDCWGVKSKVLLWWGNHKLFSGGDHSWVVVWLPGELCWHSWGELRARMGGQYMGEGWEKIYHMFSMIASMSSAVGEVWGSLEAYSATVFPQLLSFLCSGVQMYIFPVFWSGINCTETRKCYEESSGAIRIGCSCFDL